MYGFSTRVDEPLDSRIQMIHTREASRFVMAFHHGLILFRFMYSSLSLSLALSSLITRLRRRKAKELRREWRMRRQRALFHRSFNANHRKTLASLPSLSASRSEKPFLFSLSLDGRLGKDSDRPAPRALRIAQRLMTFFPPKHDEMHHSIIPFVLPALSLQSFNFSY